MIHPLKLIFWGWALMASVMAVLWLYQRSKENATAVDAGWAAGLGILAVFYAANSPGYGPRRLLVSLLAGLWSLRLSSYLFFSRVLGKPEDGRYQALRRSWGKKRHFYFFLFFQLQALLDAVFSIPFLAILQNQKPSLSAWEWAGAAVWILAVSGESLADRQLFRFKSDPLNGGKTCREGLWRYSRHPNYFFEWIHWWSYVLMGIGSPYGRLTLLGPALMSYFLLKVTGIPAAEAQALASRKDYGEYRRTTSAFIPWFPKKD